MQKFNLQTLNDDPLTQNLRKTSLHQQNKQNFMNKNKNSDFNENRDKGQLRQKIGIKQSTDATSKESDQIQLRMTKKTKSGKKIKNLNLQEIKNNGQLEQLYKNDPIFKLRVDIMMREAQKKSLTGRTISKGKQKKQQKNKVQNFTEEQDEEFDLRTTTLRKKKNETQSKLKKYAQIYQDLIVNKIICSAVMYGITPSSPQNKNIQKNNNLCQIKQIN